MARIYVILSFFLIFAMPATATNLATASSNELLTTYEQLRAIQAGNQSAIVENVVFKRDAATFTLINGSLTFSAPIAGRVVGAVFQGDGTFELDPPSPMDQRQIARFTKAPKLVDDFHNAVFFFTDDSYDELAKLVNIRTSSQPDATAAFQSAEKKYSEDFNYWVDNQRMGNPTMRNLAARMLADLSDPSSRGFFLADFKGKRSGDLLFHISWNRNPILLFGSRTSDEVMLLHVNRQNYYEWWSGFHLSSEYAQSQHPEHRNLLAHCISDRLDADVAKDNRLSATAEMEFEVPGGTVRVIPFNLDGVLRISSITDDSGNKLAFIQEDRKLDSDPWLILPTPAQPDKTYKTKITYQEDSTRYSRVIYQRGNGLFYVTAREWWFPSFGDFDDRTQFELHFQSPAKFKFIGTGELVDSKKDKDILETTWKSQIPLSVVGFNYGDFVQDSHSNPELTVTAYAGHQVPDELQGLQSTLDIMQLANHGRGDAAAQYGIATGGFNTASNVKYAAAVSFQAFEVYNNYFGPLPFKNVAVTEQPIRGYGQSWPTLIFLPYDSLLDSTTRNSLRLQQTAEEREFYNVVAVHEMAHQWWGHLVGWKTYRDEWMSEGFAEFAAALYLQQFEPDKWDSFWELKRKWLLSNNRVGQRPVDAGPLWLGYQVDQYLAGNWRVLTYYKGAYVLEMLRMLMRDPRRKNPDETFIAMMRDFASTYAGKNASTEDFRHIVEKHIGQPMDWFFNEWVYGSETPTYDFRYQMTDAGGGKTNVSMTVTQSGVSDSFRMHVPIDAVENGHLLYLGMATLQGSKTITGNLTLPFRPEKIVLDGDHSVLATIRQ